jgi:hypothetical protein
MRQGYDDFASKMSAQDSSVKVIKVFPKQFNNALESFPGVPTEKFQGVPFVFAYSLSNDRADIYEFDKPYSKTETFRSASSLLLWAKNLDLTSGENKPDQKDASNDTLKSDSGDSSSDSDTASDSDADSDTDSDADSEPPATAKTQLSGKLAESEPAVTDPKPEPFTPEQKSKTDKKSKSRSTKRRKKAFIATKKWKGEMKGYEFKMGDLGVGYYQKK